MSFRFGGARRYVALLTIFVVLVTPAVFADDINPNEPPEARIKPPIGVQSTSATIGDDINPNEPPEARIKPPGGVQTMARIGPPTGSEAVSFFDLTSDWIALYARLMTLFM